ncbi:MAG: T9SS type A sorting domain-containing protein [bacterium]|nr:T9SS type A sorting domain-containing protein [bacterium]
MKRTILPLLAVLCAVTTAFGQLPVWPLVTGFPQSGPTIDNVSTTPHQFVDWTAGTPTAINIPSSASNNPGPTQAGVNGCNELVFFTLHNGDFNAATAALQIYTPAGTYLPLPGGDMNASVGDDEVQIVRRPGYPNQWFVVYNMAPALYPSGHPGYQASNLAYSLITVNSTSADYVDDAFGNPIQDIILTENGNTHVYFPGKATSRTSVVVGGDHDIYIQRRVQAPGSSTISNTFYIDRFTVSNTDEIIYSGSSSMVTGYSWYLMVAGSPIELSPTENSLAVMARTQNDDEQQIYLFDPANLAAAPNTITISDLELEFTAPPTPLTGLYHQPVDFDASPGTNFDWLKNFERKISGLEYSPSGDYLYICGGGYVAGSTQNLTYLVQIDLTQTVNSDHPARIQVQQANTANTYNTNTGAGNTWSAADYTNLWEFNSLSRMQSCYDGNLYFTKGRHTDLFVLPTPDNPLPINMTPSVIDFSTGLVPNITTNGFVTIMPDQIDGFDYSISNYTSVTFNLSNQSLCTCDTLDIEVVNANTGVVFETITITDCPTPITLCVENNETYNLVGSNGVTFNNAIVSGNYVYPAGTNMFNFGNGGAINTTFTTVTTPLITSDEVWEGHYFVPDNMIVVVDNATLDLTNVDIVFGECAGIDFTNGAQLRANNSVLRPCDYNGVWRGLSFYEGPQGALPTGIVNECTFKNAQIALNSTEIQRIDLRVTNNLFSNCKVGVNNESTTFLRSISGNTFLLDDIAPNFSGFECSPGFPGEFFGVRGRNVIYSESIAQNDFVAPDFTTVDFTGIESFSCTSLDANSNHFTNTFRSIHLDADRNATIESNEIEVSSEFSGFEHQIAMLNCDNVLVSGNEIVNTSQHLATAWAGNNSAIYVDRGRSYDIKENHVEGFETGVQTHGADNIHITDNEITNCQFYGIYMERLRDVEATCNAINMEWQSNGNAVGIGYYTDLTSAYSNKIASNCIMETNTAMYLEGTGGAASNLPVILNNYMYNYSSYGVQLVNTVGNIGSSPSPALGAGRNSFITNNGLGVIADIASTNPVTSFGNFGVSFVTGGVSISGNNVNSTASCGHQIDLANSSNGYMEICDDLSEGAQGIMINNGLTNDFETEVQHASAYQLEYVLHNLHEAGSTEFELFYETVSNSGVLTGNEALWFDFAYATLKDDVTAATAVLATILPSSDEETNRIVIASAMLTETDALAARDLDALDIISQSDSRYRNIAKSVLYNFGAAGARDYYATLTPKNIDDASVIEVDETVLTVFPNPTTGEISFEYTVEEGQTASLVVFDMTGKQVALFDLDFDHSTQKANLIFLPEGVYTMSIQVGNETVAHSKLIKL